MLSSSNKVINNTGYSGTQVYYCFIGYIQLQCYTYIHRYQSVISCISIKYRKWDVSVHMKWNKPLCHCMRFCRQSKHSKGFHFNNKRLKNPDLQQLVVYNSRFNKTKMLQRERNNEHNFVTWPRLLLNDYRQLQT